MVSIYGIRRTPGYFSVAADSDLIARNTGLRVARSVDFLEGRAWSAGETSRQAVRDNWCNGISATSWCLTRAERFFVFVL